MTDWPKRESYSRYCGRARTLNVFLNPAVAAPESAHLERQAELLKETVRVGRVQDPALGRRAEACDLAYFQIFMTL